MSDQSALAEFDKAIGLAAYAEQIRALLAVVDSLPDKKAELEELLEKAEQALDTDQEVLRSVLGAREEVQKLARNVGTSASAAQRAAEQARKTASTAQSKAESTLAEIRAAGERAKRQSEAGVESQLTALSAKVGEAQVALRAAEQRADKSAAEVDRVAREAEQKIREIREEVEARMKRSRRGLLGGPSGGGSTLQVYDNGLLLGPISRLDFVDGTVTKDGDRVTVDMSGTYLAQDGIFHIASPVTGPARFDTRHVQRGAMTSGSAVLTSATAAFTADDVGKAVFVLGAGASGAPLVTTIASYQSATQVTLAAAASTTVVDSRTVSNGTTTYGSRTVTSSTAAFTASDLGKTVTLISGGNTLVAEIVEVTNSTTVKLSMFPQFTTSTATFQINGPDVLIGTDDTAEVAAAIAAAQDSGEGIVFLPDGIAFVTSTLTVTGGDQGPRDTQHPTGLTFMGVGQKKSGIFAAHAGTAIHYSGYREMAHFDNVRLIGPGRHVAGSRGLFFDGASGFLNLRNVLIDHFETGAEFDDITGSLCANVVFRDNKYGLKTDYNYDAHQWSACAWQRNTTAVVIGNPTAAHTGPGMDNTSLEFQACLFNHNELVFSILDAAVCGITWRSCYFEGNTKEGNVGSSSGSVTNALSGLAFERCYWNPYTNGGAAPVAEGWSFLQRVMASFRGCKVNGTTSYTVFVKNYQTDGSTIIWENNSIQAVTAAILYQARNYNPVEQRLVLGGAQMWNAQGDVAPLSTTVWFLKQMAGATGRTFERWTQINGTTGAELNSLDVRNVGGVMQITGTAGDAYITATSKAALPTASSNYRGCLAFVPGGAGVADVIYWCRKNAADAYEWQALA